PITREADYSDTRYTENTRVSYPIEHIPNALIPGIAGHPEVVILLTADAFGVMPPVAKLTKEKAVEFFLLGYTSKLAGTERGVVEPQATFSACFGAPFMPLHPQVYAKMLGEKISQHGSRTYLVNTGWMGGPYGVGKRIDITYTRAIVHSLIDGSIESYPFREDPIFGFLVPEELEGVPRELLHPRSAWRNGNEFDKQAKKLQSDFAAAISHF
ncbi:MAG TPA: phosphoenolpyruvate carboxykinase (ATP), partial [Candidatus Atribacteria bacterium]|nr:phosphoenolpyruvate carboxykinase (ATP) [Candidatus Atribacteria bacterium]